MKKSCILAAGIGSWNDNISGLHKALLPLENRPVISHILDKLNDDIEFINRKRLSKLSYTGHKKISRIGRKTAIIAFSAEEVYAIAELIRRQKGGAATVSYTHLRAHETLRHLVCRLLLEKKK